MKTINKIGVLLLLLAAASGCDFLKVDKLGKDDIPKFFSNIEGVRLANQGVYRGFYDLYNADYMKYSEVAADMTILTPGVTDMLDQYDYTSLPNQEKGAPGNIWTDGYVVLANVNHLLHYAPILKEEYPNYGKEIDNIMAQALFFRALTHFVLCNCYAQPYNYTPDASHLGVSLTTGIHKVTDRIKRSSVADTYALILEDLNTAIGMFGNSTNSDRYYVSAMTCKAFLARVYLYMENWEKARDYAGEVIAAHKLTSNDKYISMIRSEISERKDDESVFRLSGKKISSHKLREFYSPANRNITASDKFMGTFYADNDVRRQLFDGRSIYKYDYAPGYDPTKTEEEQFYAPIVFRASEMYLIRAEAYCHLNEPGLAAADLKSIIARAQGIASDQITLPGTPDQLIPIVKRERILELAEEGHRFFDIVRYKEDMVRDNNTTSIVKRMNYPNDKFVLPISALEMEVNVGIQQNPGY